MKRRKFLRTVGLGLATCGAVALAAVSARAQAFPSRPITMIVPFVPGGTTDFEGRLIAEPMRDFVGQPIVIENVSGADGSIGTGRVARAAPDGYTIGFGFLGTHVLNAALYSLPYDVLTDFVPISLLTQSAPFLFGSKAIPATDLEGLIAWLKANPEKGTTAAYTAGSRLLSHLFAKHLGQELTFVPYRGQGPATQDLVSRQINLLFATSEALPQVRAGNIRAYAVTGEKRLAVALDVPTFAEKGIHTLDYSVWYGLFAPKGTPKEIIAKLNAATVKALGNATVRARLAEIGQEVFPPDRLSPEAFVTFQKAEFDKWVPIIKEAGIKPE